MDLKEYKYYKKLVLKKDIPTINYFKNNPKQADCFKIFWRQEKEEERIINIEKEQGIILSSRIANNLFEKVTECGL